MKIFHKITKESFQDFVVATRQAIIDIWAERRNRVIALLCLSFFVALVPYGVSGISALLINYLVPRIGTGSIDTVLVALLFLSAFAFLARAQLFAAMQYWLKMTWFDMRQMYELKLSAKSATLDMATHEDPKFQDELQVIKEQGASFVVASFVEAFVTNLQNVVGFMVASGIVLIADWRLFLLILFASLPRFYTELRYGEGIWSIYQAKAEERRKYVEVKRHTEHIASIRELQTFQTVEHFLEREAKLLKEFFDAQRKEEQEKLKWQIGSQFVLAIALGISLSVLVITVLNGGMQIGTFTFVVSGIMGLQNAVAGFFLAIAKQHRDSRYVKAYFDILERTPYISQSPKAMMLPLVQAPMIEFRNVSFAYPTAPDTYVLRNFSLTIESGERLAFVGVNGAGKSTFIKLLCRFYDPTDGQVLVNGIDLKNLDLNEWYSHLALLSQDYATYRFTVSELIQLGRMNGQVNPPKIRESAHRAAANTFIEKWTDQYDQQIGVEFRGGVNPSHGQKQKLALARTLFRNAFVTILDEPTAHVDAGTEKEIFERLEREVQTKQTLILVSHRFSTVRNADRICVIDKGSVSELGTHKELVALNGTYAGLFESQAESYR